MHLFYSPRITQPLHTLEEAESRHAVKVLRLRTGDPVSMTDGRGNMYAGEIYKVDTAGCQVKIISCSKEHGKRGYALTMAVAPTKNLDRFEWFLEKATEIGCDRFVPLFTERSERRIFRHDRSMRVITSAMKQSFSAWHPVLEEPVSFREFIAREVEGERFMAHCDRNFARVHLFDYLQKGSDGVVMIGPEGDFSPAEIGAAAAAGYRGVTLGDSRLRTETAALMAVSAAALLNR